MDQITNIIKRLVVAVALCTAFISEAESLITVDPAPGTVESLSTFSIHFNGDWGLIDRSSKFTVTGPEGVEIPTVRSGSQQSFYIVYFDNDQEITTAGTYILTVPGGKFSVAGQIVPETTFEYTVVPPETPIVFPEYTISPAEGVYQTLSEGFRITFDTEDPISVDSTAVTISGVEQIYSFSITVDNEMHCIDMVPVNDGGNQVVINTPGDYNLIFERKAISVGKATNKHNIIFRYTVTGKNVGNWTGKYTVEPSSGSEVTSLKDIKVVFTGAGVVKISDSAGPAQFPHLINSETKDVVCSCTAFAAANVLDISLTQEVTAGGKYTLVIPTAFIKIDGYNPPENISLEYSIAKEEGNIEYSYTLSPASGSNLGSTEMIFITFDGPTLASVDKDSFAWGNKAPHFTNDFGGYNPYVLIAQNNKTFAFSHDWPFEDPGTYNLVIPAGYFTLIDQDGNKYPSDAITASYNLTLTSITDLSNDNSVYEIYDITGVRQNDSIENLAPGIYIVNGEKIFIK